MASWEFLSESQNSDSVLNYILLQNNSIAQKQYANYKSSPTINLYNQK